MPNAMGVRPRPEKTPEETRTHGTAQMSYPEPEGLKDAKLTEADIAERELAMNDALYANKK